MAIQGRMAKSQKNKKSAPRQKARRKAQSAGAGEYYHIEVLPRTDFVNFQTQAVGRGHIQRVAGQRSSGYWSTVKWLIDKSDAHVQDNKLVPDTLAARNVMEQLGSEPVRKLGDLFKARPRPSFRMEQKPTRSPTRAQRGNTKRSQAGRRKN
jgi:hypothetical protein